MGLSKGQKDLLTGAAIGTALNNTNVDASQYQVAPTTIDDSEIQNNIKSTEDLYTEGGQAASIAANNAGQIAANNARAAAMQGGGGKLAAALSAAQGQVDASQQAYNTQLNNAVNNAAQQNRLSTDIKQQTQLQNQANTQQANLANQQAMANAASQNSAQQNAAIQNYIDYTEAKKQAEKQRTNQNKQTAINLLGQAAGTVLQPVANQASNAAVNWLKGLF